MPYIQSNGIKICYEISGNGYPLLIISGTGADLRTPRALVPEIEEKFRQLNLNKLDLNGLKFNILSNSWSLSSDCSVNYIIVAKKN